MKKNFSFVPSSCARFQFARTPRLVRSAGSGQQVHHKFFVAGVVGLTEMLTLAASFVACIILLLAPQPADAQTSLPSDAKPLCTVSSATFASWFRSGNPSLNGTVNPTDSLHFPDQPNCSFYEWAMHTFLWVTSPIRLALSERVGGQGIVFNSTPFFDVSPADPNSNFNRQFVGHRGPSLAKLKLQAGFLGPHGLPLFLSRDAGPLEIERAPIEERGKPLVLNRSGTAVKVGRITKDNNGKAIFYTTSNVRIPDAVPMHRALIAPAGPASTRVVQRFEINGKGILIDSSGRVVELQPGEARFNTVFIGNEVLMSQKGSLVYYGITVNDVYAYFLSGVKEGKITASTFPTNDADLQNITTYASSRGVTFTDPNVLAVVLKTAWVEASAVDDPSQYVTMLAAVPTYSGVPATGDLWLSTGNTKTVQLALVGIHVVGSTKGHPEMIWATFEHINNAPHDDYTYVDMNNASQTKSADTSTGNWLFAKGGSTAFNQPRMQVAENGNIRAIVTGDAIGPSDTIRRKAWGAASDKPPNPLVIDSATSNTQVISINNSVMGMMPAGDVRKNYILTGATWTPGGVAPTGEFGTANGNEVGTSQLENTTMETYTQGNDTTLGGDNCFSCHGRNKSLDPTLENGLSHIFSKTLALSETLEVTVTRLPQTVQHQIKVAVRDSISGIPISGASVSIAAADSGAILATSQTSNDGTTTLKYPPCRKPITITLPNKPPLNKMFPAACNGKVSASNFTDTTFEAP
jgi:hypothetical protein